MYKMAHAWFTVRPLLLLNLIEMKSERDEGSVLFQELTGPLPCCAFYFTIVLNRSLTGSGSGSLGGQGSETQEGMVPGGDIETSAAVTNADEGFV